MSEPIAIRYDLRDDRDTHCLLLGSLANTHAGCLAPASRPPSPPARRSNPHSARGTAGAQTSRDFVPWRFLDARRPSARHLIIAGVQKPPQIWTCGGLRSSPSADPIFGRSLTRATGRTSLQWVLTKPIPITDRLNRGRARTSPPAQGSDGSRDGGRDWAR
jgi:hypothetical protein